MSAFAAGPKPLTFVTGNAKKLEEVKAILAKGGCPFNVVKYVLNRHNDCEKAPR